MDLTQALLALLMAITAATYADTKRRLGRVERDLSEVKVQLAAKPDRSELYEALSQKPDRAEFDSLRGDVGALRTDLTAMRTDLTHIALAVGAERPRKVE